MILSKSFPGQIWLFPPLLLDQTHEQRLSNVRVRVRNSLNVDMSSIRPCDIVDLPIVGKPLFKNSKLSVANLSWKWAEAIDFVLMSQTRLAVDMYIVASSPLVELDLHENEC